MCKITHQVYNYTLCEKYTLCVKLHTVCKITHCVQNYTLCVKVHTVLVVKLLSLEKFYTTAGTGGSDLYEVCFTVWSGCIIYYMLYVAIFWGVKLIFAQQLTDITLMEGAKSVLAELSTVSLWGNLGRIRSRYFF